MGFFKRLKQKVQKKVDEARLGTAIQRLIEDTKVKGATEKRAVNFKTLFDFTLDGDQWYEEEKAEKRAQNKTYLTFNNSENYFEEYLARLFPRNPHTGVLEVGFSVLEKDARQRAKYAAELSKTYDENYLPDILLEQGQNFLIGGAACLFYPRSPFGGAEIISLNPQNVYLIWKGRTLNGFAYKDEDAKIYRYIDKKIFVDLDFDFNVLDQKENKDCFIPFSWIPCMPRAHKHEGRSKVESLFNLDREFNQRMSDFSTRIEENTDPHRVVLSDKADEDKIKRGKGKTTVLNTGDDMKHLELSAGAEILQYIDKVELKIREKAALVDMQGVAAQSVSGLSLSYQYSGMFDRIAFMRIFWDKAFREMNRAILTYAFGAGKNYHTKPIYNSSLVYDSKSKVDEYAVMLDKSVISHRDAIDELRGVENADEKLKEIIAEKKLLAVEKPTEPQYEKVNN